jgi:hypothetical protein
MQAPRPLVPLRCGAAAVVQWASRGWQPVARARRCGELLLSRGRALRRTSSPAAAAAMSSAIERRFGPYGEPTVVIHVNDLRLFGDEARTDASGVAPAANVAAALRKAAKRRVLGVAPIAVIITGDVAADGSAEAYALAKRLVRAAFPTTRVLYLPGCVCRVPCAVCGTRSGGPRSRAACCAPAAERVRPRGAHRPGDDAAAMARAFQPDFLGPAVGDAAPLRVLLPLPKGVIPSNGDGRKHGWRVILLPLPPPGGVSASVAALKREMAERDVAADNPPNVTTQNVLLVLPTTECLHPTAGCGYQGDVDDWGNVSPAGPSDPDPLSNFLDTHAGALRLVLHGGAATSAGLARFPGNGWRNTPCAAESADFCEVVLLNYHSGLSSCTPGQEL